MNLGRMLRNGFLAVAILGVTALPAQADTVNLLVNGSFEDMFSATASSFCGSYSGCVGFHNGLAGNDNIGGWQLIGKGGVDGDGSPIPESPASILLLGSDYVEPYGTTDEMLHFRPQAGSQALDLTGEGNQGTTNGIKQSVQTTPGMTYELVFWVGHQDGFAPGYTEGPGAVALYIDGVFVGSLTATENTSGDVTWTRFTHRLTAVEPETVIAFLNGTPVGNNYAGLDSVSMVEVPEPASLTMLCVGLAAAGILLRRKH